MITTLLWDVDGTLLDFIAAEKAAIQKLFRVIIAGEGCRAADRSVGRKFPLRNQQEGERMITTLLWDVDGTLLDFIAAEKAAIRKLFREYHLGECTDKMLARYSKINRSYWVKLENGEMTKPEILVGRFHDFFESEGLDASIAAEFNEKYQDRLGDADSIVYCDDSLNLIKSLQGKVKQYAVSNGTIAAQTKKLKLSGIGELMDGIFLSEQLGYEKPNIEFFNQVFDALGPVDKSEVLIVGDSLTSDIRGGNNAEILTCWYNPNHLSAGPEYRIDYEIEDLHEILKLL